MDNEHILLLFMLSVLRLPCQCSTLADSTPCPTISSCFDGQLRCTYKGMNVDEGAIVPGAVVEFSCPQHHIVSGARSVECFESGVYSDRAPVCIYGCELSQILNGHFNGSTYLTYYQHTRVHCDRGFKTSTPLVQCIWQDHRLQLHPVPKCEPITCSAPDTPVHGYFHLNGSGALDAGRPLELFCARGFVPTFPPFYQCTYNGSWGESKPECEIITCSYPGDDEHGFYINIGSNLVFNDNETLEYNSTISLECDLGYHAKGSVVSVCGDNGEWSGNSFCELIMCPEPQLLKGERYNIEGKSVPHNVTEFAYGTVLLFQCDGGYIPDPASPAFTLECTESGRWNGSLPLCDIVTCPYPYPLEHGGYEINSWFVPFETQALPYNTTLKVVCDTGYMVNNASLIVCEANGTWTANASCEMVTCPLPESVVNGHYDFENVDSTEGIAFYFSSIVSIECLPGYTEDPFPMSRLCLANGSWSGTKPVCSALTCSIPSPPKNGLYINKTEIRVNETIEFVCLSTHTLIKGNRIRTCRVDGRFDGEEPVCEIGKKSLQVWVIAISITGGIVVLILIIVGGIYMYLVRRRKRNGNQSEEGHPFTESEIAGARDGNQHQGNANSVPGSARDGNQHQGNADSVPGSARDGNQHQGNADSVPGSARDGNQHQGNANSVPGSARDGNQHQGNANSVPGEKNYTSTPEDTNKKGSKTSTSTRPSTFNNNNIITVETNC